MTSGEREREVVNLKCVASKGHHHVTAVEVFVEIWQSIVQILKGAEVKCYLVRQHIGFTARV